jgi:hypothetical protein
MNSLEAKRNARKIEAYRLRLIQDRWLCTVILTVHLEIEAMLTEFLCKILPEPEKLFRGRNPSFAQKLALCEALRILNARLAAGIRAVNVLRNELAHSLNDVPTIEAQAMFIAAMSGMHPLTVSSGKGTATRELRTFQQIHDHFLRIERDQMEQFVFVSLLLLRAKVVGLLDEFSPQRIE